MVLHRPVELAGDSRKVEDQRLPRARFQVLELFPYTKDELKVGVSSLIPRKNGAQRLATGPSEPQRFDAAEPSAGHINGFLPLEA